jgi:penicillin-binding protein 4B
MNTPYSGKNGCQRGCSFLSIEKASKRRVFLSLLVLCLIWAALIGRLLWIQILGVHTFSSHQIDLVKDSVDHRKQEIVLDTGRGMIKDRNGELLTGNQVTGVALFPLVRGHLEEKKITKLANIIGMDTGKLNEMIQKVKEPTFLHNDEGKLIALTDDEAKTVESLDLPGISALPVTERYQLDGVGAQLIGYVSKNPGLIEQDYAQELKNGELTKNSLIGISGLERSFQPFLQGVGPTTISYFVDGRGNPLNGLKPKLIDPKNEFYPLSLITTIDKSLQQKVEQAMREEGINMGSVVVLDAKTREVLAMASRPDFHPSSIDMSNGNWANRAIKQTFPGSIFKTVIAAAVLEEGLVKPDENFFCSGEYGKYGFSCWKKGGHGEITFSDAYAQSCNITFAKAAMRLPEGKIDEYAKKLGLEQKVGWQQSPFFKMNSFYQFSGEDAGRVFAPNTSDRDEGVIIQTAIGQRDVQITPLQAANMVATIVNGGEKKQVKVVKEIDYKTGSMFYSFDDQELPGDQIRPETANELKKMMTGVVTNGTGKSLQGATWKLAGKTGTAQVTVKGENRNNQWFIGYGPEEDPKYTIAVLAEQEPATGPNKVLPLVKKVMNELAEMHQ